MDLRKLRETFEQHRHAEMKIKQELLTAIENTVLIEGGHIIIPEDYRDENDDYIEFIIGDGSLENAQVEEVYPNYIVSEEGYETKTRELDIEDLFTLYHIITENVK